MVVIGAADEPVLSFKATACDGKDSFQNNACSKVFYSLIASFMSVLLTTIFDSKLSNVAIILTIRTPNVSTFW